MVNVGKAEVKQCGFIVSGSNFKLTIFKRTHFSSPLRCSEAKESNTYMWIGEAHTHFALSKDYLKEDKVLLCKAENYLFLFYRNN